MSEATVNTKRSDGSNRVVITGMGAITPAGVGVEALWKAVMGRECCIRPIERFDTTDYEVHNAGEICGFDATEHGLTKKESRRFERFVQYAIVASDEAIAQAGLSMEDEDPSRVSVVFGSGIGGIDELESGFKTLFEKGPKRVSPLFVPTMIGNIRQPGDSLRHERRVHQRRHRVRDGRPLHRAGRARHPPRLHRRGACGWCGGKREPHLHRGLRKPRRSFA